jgi:hypothetical protein
VHPTAEALAKRRMKKKFQKAIGSIFFAALVISLIALFVSRCGFALVPVKTKYAYQPILKYRWEAKNIVEHFPAEIPDEAQNIKFYYRAGFMQGGTAIELRMQMPEREFDSIVQKNRTMTKLILDHLGKDIATKSQKKVYFAPPLKFHTVSRSELTDENQMGPLPVGYEIFLLHLKKNKSYWNHGKIAGIAVGHAKKEIIYWASIIIKIQESNLGFIAYIKIYIKDKRRPLKLYIDNIDIFIETVLRTSSRIMGFEYDREKKIVVFTDKT